MLNKMLLGIGLLCVTIPSGYAESIHLLDKDLSQFEIWMGIPHSDDKSAPQEPLGLNADTNNVFTVVEQDGVPVLHISGEIYGGLTTLKEYDNYHLSVKFRWGETKWPPRLEAKRDSGILYHCYGPHGRFWSVWKTCLEFQVQESDLGDFIALGGNSAVPPVGRPVTDIRGDGAAENKRFDPACETYFKGLGYISAASEHDSSHGEWNHLELYVIGNDAVHVVNGHVVMVVENAHRPDGTPLVAGQIQLQSEAAECFYKEMVLTPVEAFPASILKQVRFKDD